MRLHLRALAKQTSMKIETAGVSEGHFDLDSAHGPSVLAEIRLMRACIYLDTSDGGCRLSLPNLLTFELADTLIGRRTACMILPDDDRTSYLVLFIKHYAHCDAGWIPIPLEDDPRPLPSLL
ncbi:hypothetical protein ACLOJK_033405 [Asimina triloba]